MQPANDINEQPAAEAEIRELIAARINAVRAKDVQVATTKVAHHVVAFDAVDAFQQVGIEAMRDRARSWFSSFADTIGVEMRDLTVAVDGNIAFARSLNRYCGKGRSDDKVDIRSCHDLS